MKLIDERNADTPPGRVAQYRAIWRLGDQFCELSHNSSQSWAYLYLGTGLHRDNCNWPYAVGIWYNEAVIAGETWEETKEHARDRLLELYL